MHLRISNHDTNQINVCETTEGTYVNLKKPNQCIEPENISPWSGVSLRIVQQSIENLENYESTQGIFLPCKFDELHVEGSNSKVFLSGIKKKRYSVSVDGSHNSVIFTCESEVGCVDWKESGSQNILNISQQENTSTQGNFSSTTVVITKCHKMPECTLCCENPIDTLLIPCGHLGMCRECARRCFKERNSTAICPFCKDVVHNAQTLFVM